MKKKANEQDTVKNAEDVTTVETEAAKTEMSGQNLTEVHRHRRKQKKLFRRQIPSYRNRRKAGITGIKQIIGKPGEIPVFLLP